MKLTGVLRGIRLRSFSYLVGSLVLAIVAGGLILLERSYRSYEQLLAESVQSAAAVANVEAQIETALARSQASLLGYLHSGQETDLQDYRDTQTVFFQLAMKLASLAKDVPQGDLADRLQHIRERQEIWRQQFALPAISLMAESPRQSVPPEMLGAGLQLSADVREELAGLRRHNNLHWEQLLEQLKEARQRQRYWLIGTTVAVLLCSMGLLIWLTYSIESPLAELNRLARLVVRGGRFQGSPGAGFLEFHRLFESCALMVQSLRERESQLVASQANTARTNQDLAMLTDYAKFVHRVSDEDEITNALVEQVRRITSASQIGFYVRHRLHPEYRLAVSRPPVDDEGRRLLDRIDPQHCSVLRNSQPLRVLDRRSELSASCQHGCQGFRSELCVPVSAGGEVLGVLHLASDTSLGWSSETVELVTSLANFTGPAISMLRSLENMWERATRDTLTGLHNRRYMEEHLPLAIKGAQREGGALSLLIFDIDHFKRVNDTLGHDAGDRVLCQVARSARQTLRGSDVLCRFGGEEFVVALPQTDARGAMVLAEKLRQRIAENGAEPIAASGLPVTVSAGVAVYPEHGEDHEVLLKAADLALYRAKSAGRNRVQLFDKSDTTRLGEFASQLPPREESPP